MMSGDVAPDDVLRLIVDGFHAVDHGVRVVDPPITDDFSLTLGDRTIDADAYRGVIAARADATYVTRHLVSNVRFVERSDDRVRVEFVATVHRLEQDADGATTNVVDFSDEWVHVGGEWRQRSRTISPVFVGIGS